MNGNSIEHSLKRLVLSNQIREMADYPTPVTVQHLAYTGWLLNRVVWTVYWLVRFVSQRPRSRWKRSPALIIMDSVVLVLLRVLVNKTVIWRHLKNAVSRIFRNGLNPETRYHHSPDSEITGHVSSSDGEQLLIRVCLWLRLNRRYGACIEFLLRRLNSGLPAEKTREWLSFFLREIKDNEAAQMIRPITMELESDEPQLNCAHGTDGEESAVPHTGESGLNYGVIITTMFDSPVFRASLLSFLRSDYRGHVVVVEEGNQLARTCESFCESLPVTYVKSSRWVGVNGLINLAMEEIGSSADIIIFGHNDVLWPPNWFGQLDEAWGKVFHEGKVGILNLGCLEFLRGAEPVLYELFTRNQYTDLAWILNSMRKSPALIGKVYDFQSPEEHAGQLFGIDADWTMDSNQIKVKLNVGLSFPSQTWRDLGGFDPNMGNDFADLEYYGFKNKKWNLLINNDPLIHMQGEDTMRLQGAIRAEWQQLYANHEETFLNKTGWTPTHARVVFWGESVVVHYEEIVEAINTSRFSDVDFVFDEFFERLERKRFSNCDFAWCPVRHSCRYV